MKKSVILLWLLALGASCAVEDGTVDFETGGAAGEGGDGNEGGFGRTAGGGSPAVAGASGSGGSAGNLSGSGSPGIAGGGTSGSSATTQGGNNSVPTSGGAPSETPSAGAAGEATAGAGGVLGTAGAGAEAGSGGVEGDAGGSGGFGGEEGGDEEGGAGGTGGDAEPVNPCQPNPCQNQGTCSVDGAGYKCQCSNLWLGPQCATPNPCLQPTNPCRNSGTCSVTNSGYSCACSDAYRGPTCEFRKFRGIGPGTPRALSGNGRFVVGEACDNAGVCLPARADVDQANSFGQLPGPSAPAFDDCFGMAVNTAGDWVGGYCSPTYFGISWTAAAGTTVLPGPSNSEPIESVNDVSGDGSIVVGAYRAMVQGSSTQRAFRRTTSSGVVALAPVAATDDSIALAVSTNGLIVVGRSGGTPFRWHPDSGTVALPLLAGYSFQAASGVSDDGSVIVGTAFPASGPGHVVRWVNGGQPQDLGAGSIAGVSSDGGVVVGSLVDVAGGACVWGRTGAPTPLLTALGAPSADTTGWTNLSPAAVSNDGKVVVGIGTHNAQQEIWVAHLP